MAAWNRRYTPPTAPLSAQSIETLGACCQTAYRKCLESVAYHQQREGGGSVLSSDAVKEMERLEGEMQKITHALAELELAQSPTVGASVPVEIAETIRIALSGTRKRAIDLTHWDYEHERRTDAALAWLSQQQKGGE